MKAIVLDGGRGPVIRESPRPRLEEGEVLIAVDACGLCGSDLLKLKDPHTTGPVLGHEAAGRIAEAGRKVTGFRPGERVIVSHHVPCGTCHYCRRDSPSMCRQFKATNIEPGGFSEFVKVSAKHVESTLLRIPDSLDTLSATFTEPLACCLRNVKRLKIGSGDAVGVVGLGSIGLLTGQLVLHRKAKAVGFELDPARAELARSFGIVPAKPGDDTVSRLTEGRGLDALIFTAGPTTLAAEGLSWLRDGGCLGVFAEFSTPIVSFDINTLYHRELSVVASYSSAPEDLREALDLLASGAVDAAPLIGGRFGLEEFNEAVRKTRSRELLKAIIEPSRVAAEIN